MFKEQSDETPTLWRIAHHAEGFTLGFTYNRSMPLVRESSIVHTRRGEPKLYKSLNACFSDIKKIDSSAVVQFVYRPDWPAPTGSHFSPSLI